MMVTLLLSLISLFLMCIFIVLLLAYLTWRRYLHENEPGTLDENDWNDILEK